MSILVAVLLLKLEKKKPTLLFTAYDLNIGGIEKALINLVNKINLDKYAVEIVSGTENIDITERDIKHLR